MNRKEYNNAVMTYSENIFRYAFKWTRNEQDARDLVQDVFGKLWEYRKKVDYAGAKPWLFTCAHNALVNFSKRRREMESLADVKGMLPHTHQPDLGLKDLLKKSLETLSPVQRSVVILRDSEGYSYEEIGDILELSESQVKVYLFRARQKVKEQLKLLSELVA